MKVEELIRSLDSGGIGYGREDAFKLLPGQVLGGRVLIGINSSELPVAQALVLAAALGMPGAARRELAGRAAQANAVFVGIEEQRSSTVYKVYLEFWDQVRREVQQCSPPAQAATRLVHLGVKWDSADPARHVRAYYHCHPMLGTRDILRRMRLPFEPNESALCDAARSIVRLGARRQPGASMLYLEVSEENNPRASCDINLYKTGLRVADAAAQLERAAAGLDIAPCMLAAAMQPLQDCPLGHLSCGIDRHGREFLSVYAETR
jgi:hypothetical protein